MNISKDGNSSASLDICSSTEPCTGDYFFFLPYSQKLPCSLLLYISTEESQLLPSTSKLLLQKTANTNHFNSKALNVKHSMPGLTGTVYSPFLLTRQSQCCNFSLFLNSVLKWEHFSTVFRQMKLTATGQIVIVLPCVLGQLTPAQVYACEISVTKGPAVCPSCI